MILFSERQKFTQWWLWAILIPIMLWPLWIIYTHTPGDGPNGHEDLSYLESTILALLIVGITGMTALLELRTEIDDQEIRIHFFPFLKKTFLWRDISKAEVINYGFVGGWGIRLWTKYGTVYNVKGKHGMAIILNNGKKYVIGTQKTEELKRVIAKKSFDIKN